MEPETYVEDYSRFPMTETRRLSEIHATRPTVDDLDLTEVERMIRSAPPNTAVEVPPSYMEAILAQRHTVHGDFTDDAEMAQGLKNLMRQGKNWGVLKPCQAECLDQMQTKIARILAGDPNHPDHWRDLQGYPRLVEERL